MRLPTGEVSLLLLQYVIKFGDKFQQLLRIHSQTGSFGE